jgi:hypothetical protein
MNNIELAKLKRELLREIDAELDRAFELCINKAMRELSTTKAQNEEPKTVMTELQVIDPEAYALFQKMKQDLLEILQRQIAIERN